METYRKFLAATDGSESGGWAIQRAVALARAAGGDVRVLTVVDSFVFPPLTVLLMGESYGAYLARLEGAVREKAVAQARAAGLEPATVEVRHGRAAQVIVETAREAASDVIVLGGHPNPSLAHTIVGSTAERVLRLAERPCLVAVGPARDPLRRILVALDLSPQSASVLAAARELAGTSGAELRVLYVVAPLPAVVGEIVTRDRERARRYVEGEIGRVLEAADLDPAKVSRVIREGHPGREIVAEAASWKADLIAAGTHGFGRAERWLVGSVSSYILRHADRSVLLVPPAG